MVKIADVADRLRSAEVHRAVEDRGRAAGVQPAEAEDRVGEVLGVEAPQHNFVLGLGISRCLSFKIFVLALDMSKLI